MELPPRPVLRSGRAHPCVLSAPARAWPWALARSPGADNGRVFALWLMLLFAVAGARGRPRAGRRMVRPGPARHPAAAHRRPLHLRHPRRHRARRRTRDPAAHGRRRPHRQHRLRPAAGRHRARPARPASISSTAPGLRPRTCCAPWSGSTFCSAPSTCCPPLRWMAAASSAMHSPRPSPEGKERRMANRFGAGLGARLSSGRSTHAGPAGSPSHWWSRAFC